MVSLANLHCHGRAQVILSRTCVQLIVAALAWPLADVGQLLMRQINRQVPRVGPLGLELPRGLVQRIRVLRLALRFKARWHVVLLQITIVECLCLKQANLASNDSVP